MPATQQDWTVLAMLKWGTDYFTNKELPDPRYSIEWLLAEVLGVKRLDLYLHFDRPLSKKELDNIRPLIKKRAGHEPLQYITGQSEFMNTLLSVTPDVLIPRMETEQLVEIILEDHHCEESLSVLDVGTGSGCIAVALKMERPSWKVTALDISHEALTVAKENAVRNETDIKFMKYDILEVEAENFSASFDLIISNPPYVLPEEKESLEPQVAEYEPAEALFCRDIEMMYQKIIDLAGGLLASGGSLYLEIHTRQKDKISALFENQKWEAKQLKDYAGNDRFMHAKKRS